jgi:hypothetical protein
MTFKTGQLVYWAEEPENRGVVTKISPSGGLVWVYWFASKETNDVYSRILRPFSS